MKRKITDIFHPGEIEAQRRFNSKTEWTERAVDAANQLYKQAIDEDSAFFIEAQKFFFIATSDDKGNCDCSFRGSEDDSKGESQPAILVVDSKTLVFPDYSGNKMYNSLGNILSNPKIGILFVSFTSTSRLRVNGRAEIVEDSEAYSHIWSTSRRYVRVTVDQVFTNCSRRIPNAV